MSDAYTNHLINEKSPYLLQHAHNPVDWYPWGNEAFELAQNQDKPIFLSIGYATCHWCHVMERESFTHPEIAKLLNEAFITIKIDREELPEIDSLYMEFAQALMSSAGGWPLNLLLTPTLKPFFAVTYLPPKTRRGMVGLEELILNIKQLWQSDERQQLIEQADKIVEIFEHASISSGHELPREEQIQNSVQLFFDLADPLYGGIKGEPKFPLGYQGNFLLNFTKLKNESRALFYVELTLDKMLEGGIYDHLGGGFCRYAVDERWRIPHFEKMLYDNAILACAYLEAGKFTKKKTYLEAAASTLHYVLREMTHPEGGFYSAEDADTDGHEGLYYTWTFSEIQELLPSPDRELFCQFYGVSPQGNFEGRNILHIDIPLEEFAEIKGLSIEQLTSHLDSARALLLKKRETRPHPFKDDKILSSWNGLMIDVMAKAGNLLNEPRFREAALKAAMFIKTNLWKEGRLLRRFREGEGRFRAGLDEYAFLIKGLLTLFEEGQGSHWLEWAMEMAALLEREFKAPKGAFFQTDGVEPILIRKCEFYDGAEPSGNGVHCENLLRLYQLTQRESYLKQAEDILKAAKSHIETYPPGACYHLIALQRYLDLKAATVVIALNGDEKEEKELSSLFAAHFCPHISFIWKKREDAHLLSLLPFLEDKKLIEGQTAIYICRADRCEPPLTKREEIIKAVERL